VSKKRKSVEVIHLVEHSEGFHSKFNNSSSDKKFKISDECVNEENGLDICPMKMNDHDTGNFPEEEQIIDDVWDNFGDHNQFDNDYGGFQFNENSFMKATCKNELFSSESPELKQQEISQNNNNDSNIDEQIEINFEAINNEPELLDLTKDSEDEIEDFLKRPKQLDNIEIQKPSYQQEQDACNTTPRIEVTKKKSHLTNLKQKHKEKSQSSDDQPLTPMPNYTGMNTPNLKDELKKYGLKQLSKKQAIKKLTEIYEFTHKSKLKRSISCMDLNSAAANNETSKKKLTRCESSSNIEKSIAERTSKPKKKS